MALPVVVSVSLLTTGISPQTVALPPVKAVDDILLMQVASSLPNVPVTIANAAGGTWSPIGGFGGSQANEGVRGTWFWSRYNETQTAPTLNDTGGGVQHAYVVAIRGCISTTTPIDGEIGYQPIFAETTSTLPGLSTGGPDRLVLDCIVGEGPDVDGTNVYGTWTNSSLTSPTELVDSSSAAGTGGSLGIQAGGVPTQTTTSATTVTHANFRVVGKKIAFAPAVLSPVLRFDRNSRSQPVINGVARFVRGVYDADFAGANNQDIAGHVAARNYARYRFDIVVHPQNGTVGNSLRFANVLAPMGMFIWTTGNFFGNFTFPPENFVPATNNYDVYNNNVYTIPPQGTGAFRDLWRPNPGAAGTYIADEPAYVATGWAGDPPPVPATRGRDDMVVLHNYNKSVMPEMPTFSTFINDNITQWRDWSPFAIGDWLGCDIYTIGQAPELAPGNGVNLVSTYGYMNWTVAEAAALACHYCPPYGRVPHVVLGVLKFGGSSRFITLSEVWSHMVIAVTELRGVGAIIWWALGNQDGALDQRPFQVSSGNGTQTVFPCPNQFTEEAVDVEVKINNVIQPQSSFTVQNLGSTAIVRSGNFWVLQNPPTVTLTTAPPAGTNNVVVTTWRNPQTKRNAIKQLLEDMTVLLASLESIMIQPSNPALLTGNSTWQANFRAWRIPYLNLLRQGPSDNRPVWLEGARLRYQTEYDDLNLPTPTYTASEHMMDPAVTQYGNVRTCCWESGNVGIVAAHNVHPDPQNNVSLQWHSTVTRVEVLGENRDVPVTGGNTWTDTFGGASSLRQGPFNQGHLYRLTLSGVTPPTAYTMLALPGSYDVTGATAVLTQIAGPTLVGFVWRR